MKFVILDSCALINLLNAEILKKIFKLDDHVFYIGELVRDECFAVDEQKKTIEFFINKGVLKVLEGQISFTEFKDIKNKFGLGDGETESIALSKKLNFHIATDDRKARNSALEEVGSEFLCGSLYLLKQMITQGILTCTEGLVIYKLMKIKGGFLPSVDVNYLCK
jgi:predicted nucleic acid-binding protein